MNKILRRKLKLISYFTIISIFTFFIGKNTKENTVSTMAAPVTNKVIVIDAGHRRRRWWSSKC